jgi:hypothetical protein
MFIFSTIKLSELYVLYLQHDYPQECRPGGSSGNFIMFASATSGDRPNNSKFSSCSIGNISNVLDAIEDNKKRNCFSGECDIAIHSNLWVNL